MLHYHHFSSLPETEDRKESAFVEEETYIKEKALIEEEALVEEEKKLSKKKKTFIKEEDDECNQKRKDVTYPAPKKSHWSYSRRNYVEDHIRNLVPKALELDVYLDENKVPNVKIHEKEEKVQKKEVAIKSNQDSNGDSKEKKKNKAKKKKTVKKKSKCIEDNKKKMKSKGNLGDTRDTTINVEKKCKKN
ncbi:hypothetical protein M0812_01162 [Anaeramoeba flamelloides]|uniref:Uncharacterized protein n=1 Tax=Anaeramoeba flamelloides TaxID=1746091 RepID=A0AAV8A7D5_9EUKA|nr:hypothetical protein M0812_01162 [Anaeramoeba flamelloides]